MLLLDATTCNKCIWIIAFADVIQACLIPADAGVGCGYRAACMCVLTRELLVIDSHFNSRNKLGEVTEMWNFNFGFFFLLYGQILPKTVI